MSHEKQLDKLNLFRKELDAARDLGEQCRRLSSTPPVDDDFPAVKHDYDGAARAFVAAYNAAREGNV